MNAAMTLSFSVTVLAVALSPLFVRALSGPHRLGKQWLEIP
jgi:hypothetical protein